MIDTSQTYNSFKNRVLTDVTEGKRLPTKPNDDKFRNIVENTARLFWEKDDEVHESQYLVIEASTFATELFKEKRRVKLPDCVQSVEKLQITGRINGQTGYDTLTGYRVNRSYFAGHYGGASGNMLYTVAKEYYADFQRHFRLSSIRFNYNPYTFYLTWQGRDIKDAPVIAEVWMNIPVEALYNISRFYNYVCAECRISFSTIYGITDAKMIGNIGLNVGNFEKRGERAIEKIEREWEDQRKVVDFWGES